MKIRKFATFGIMAVAAGIATLDGEPAWRAARADGIQGIKARIVAVNIPGASAISQVGTFVSGGSLTPAPPSGCKNPSPIPTNFSAYTQRGAVLDPDRLLVGSRSNFGRRCPPVVGGKARSCRSIRTARSRWSFRPISTGKETRRRGSAARCRCSARTAHTGSTASTTPMRTPLNTPGSAIRWVSRTTTVLGVSGRPIRLSARTG
jgi:hypothetical protein